MFSVTRHLCLCRRSFLNRYLIRTDEFLKFIRRKQHNRVLELAKPVRLSFSCYQVVPPIVQDNVPVIIMHGLFGNKNNWASIAKAIHNETGKRVFSLDARNHGDSPHSDQHTYIHLAKDVASFMDDHSIDSGVFVGHSMGGRALMAFAMLYPRRVESLAVVDISPIGTPDGIHEMRKVFGAMQAIKLNAPGYGLYDYRKIVEAQLVDDLQDKKIGQFLSMNLVENGNGRFGWKVNLDSLLRNYDPHIMKFPDELATAAFAGPTVFICGGNSTFVDLNKVDEVKKLFPESIFMTVEGAGHWVHVDQPHKFLQILGVFIKQFRMK